MLDDEGQPVLEPLTKHDTIFAGTLVDPFNGKVGSGRPAWEAAAQDLRKAIKKIFVLLSDNDVVR